MRALVVDPSAPEAVRLTEIAEPVATGDEVLVEVRQAALNYGDLNDARSGRVPPGAVLGSDVAGVVLRSGPTGPPPGTRVVALAQGAFAEQVVVDLGALAEVPATVGLVQAAALPVAGVAALRSLRASGAVLGRRVLITGASGGVGRFAVRLASMAGAHVIASVGQVERGIGLEELGADKVVVGLNGIDAPVDVVLDSVGGPQLVAAWQLLAPDGSLQSIGWTSGEPAVFPPYSTIGPPKSLTSFVIQGSVAAELADLVHLVESGALPVEIGWHGPLQRFADGATALRDRRVNGKAILDVADQPSAS
ncbi:zinc-binding dehydrogenase [Nocardia alni]|uniref:zinc-binding dehydrogenase n=1 Tax=Nocardia alni TaxID=2815723 RepID=UPI001C2491AA|nr:zinc-binding dehydrogenase [Nocardia alni]